MVDVIASISFPSRVYRPRPIHIRAATTRAYYRDQAVGLSICELLGERQVARGEGEYFRSET